MAFLEKLKKLIGIKFDLKSFFNIHITIDKSTKNINKSKTIEIGYNQYKDKLKPILKKALEERWTIISKEASDLIKDEKQVKAIPKNKNLLEFFKDIIPPEDHTILRASVLIYEKFKKNEEVSDLKHGLIQNYGRRGKNICNLYSAGYFGGFLKEVYEIMSQDSEFDVEAYNDFYQLVVTESPYAVFISKNMDNKEVKEIILVRIGKNKKYGIKNFKIHGIGRDNCKKIRGVIEELENEMTKVGILFDKIIYEKNNIISVTLKFR